MSRITKSILITSLSFGFLLAQSSIQGTVTDTDGSPLAGANVVVDGTSVGAAAGSDGT